MAWLLTSTAIADLDGVARDGALRFGFVQSEAYERELVGMFDTLAAMPYLAVERQASQSVVRLMPSGAHNILYVVENEDVVILRVLHGLQNWFDLL
ncbi:type II toxin-antitoxin system RelE/ParE family toxin [Devosia sp. 2618]|uniref:type II toxin-antitoxin system RelE/ParE family toxin n=1 Tax=Devosia sp. 2618 TaxID=3156454 RepID=UPI0033959F38